MRLQLSYGVRRQQYFIDWTHPRVASRYSVRLAPATEPPWTDLPSTRLGRAPSGLGTPALYALVEAGGRAARRLDLYGEPGSESYFASSAIAWQDRWVAVGHGWHVYLVSTTTWAVRTLELPLYFEEFHAGAQDLLVVSGAGLTRVGGDGRVLWENAELAVDGVEVEAIDRVAGVVRGRGEWDPPGDWRPFVVRLDDGLQLPARPVA
jgi:hypothetical protein